MDYSTAQYYETCLKEVAIFATLNNERVRSPKIGVNHGLDIIDCECNVRSFSLLENYSVGHQTRGDKVKFEMPLEAFKELTNHHYTVKL